MHQLRPRSIAKSAREIEGHSLTEQEWNWTKVTIWYKWVFWDKYSGSWVRLRAINILANSQEADESSSKAITLSIQITWEISKKTLMLYSTYQYVIKIRIFFSQISNWWIWINFKPSKNYFLKFLII